MNLTGIDGGRGSSGYAELWRERRTRFSPWCSAGVLGKAFFRDVGVGVYVSSDETQSAQPCTLRSSQPTGEGSRCPGLNVAVLNHAPMWLRRRALKGIVIVDREPRSKTSLKLAAIDDFSGRTVRGSVEAQPGEWSEAKAGRAPPHKGARRRWRGKREGLSASEPGGLLPAAFDVRASPSPSSTRSPS